MAVKFKADSKHMFSSNYHPTELEKEIRRFWKENQISSRLAKKREEENIGSLGYIEGPPTLNGVPHIGHHRGRIMKDLWYRFRSMQGFHVPFWAGWDCQGLPVELEVEKELGVLNKKELLERIGEKLFVEECKKTIEKYYKEWFHADQRFGIFMNYDEAYWTYLDEYIEREWKYLEKAWSKGLLGEGYYVVAYCPHCQTSLSNAEVGLGYEEVEDPSLFFKLRVSGTDNEYFLVWTTMPFTIVTNMMLAAHPKAEYAKVKVNNEIWILARERVESIMSELEIQDYLILEILDLNALQGTKYEYPFKSIVPKQIELEKSPYVHTLVIEEFVDVETATGLVHLSPGNGEDDFLAAQKRKMTIFVPYDDECRFTEDAGEFSEYFVRDADQKVIDELKKRGLLVSENKVIHEYPTCWRSHHKLVWLARREYFLWTEKINQEVVEAAENVEYFYDRQKNRFLSFLKERKSWCISRERVWGAPIPIWICSGCKSKILLSSKKEIIKRAKHPVDRKEFELHKPWIDLTIKCEECGGDMEREPFVLDCWHNSGASTYARFTDEEFKNYVPADFLVEAVDQTRGWANSLLLQHIILTGKTEAPYKGFLFYGFVLDENGRKMSKSIGNVIQVNNLLEKQSADICRFYLLGKCAPTESMNFDYKELRKRPYQFLSTLYHLHRFFIQNAEYDRFNPNISSIKWALDEKALKFPDKWIISKLQSTVKNVTSRFEKCEYHLALSEIEEFVIKHLSRQYVPIIRKDLWSDDIKTKKRRSTIYATLWHVLRIIVVLINPVIPFLSEAVHQKVFRKLDESLPLSINLDRWPTSNEKLHDEKLEQEFDLMLKCVSIVNSARQSAQLKRRWPLKEVKVLASKQVLEALNKLEDVFLEITNVKKGEYISLQKSEEQEFDNGEWTLNSDEGITICLYCKRDEMLVGEGLIRDLARRVQTLRRDLGFVPTDILESVHISELKRSATRLIEPLLNEMNELVRTRKVYLHEKKDEINVDWHKTKLDTETIYIAIE